MFTIKKVTSTFTVGSLSQWDHRGHNLGQTPFFCHFKLSGDIWDHRMSHIFMRHHTLSDRFRRPDRNPNQKKPLIVFRYGSFFLFFLRNRTFFPLFSNFLMRCHVSEWIVSEYCARQRGSRKSGVSGDDAITSRKSPVSPGDAIISRKFSPPDV